MANYDAWSLDKGYFSITAEEMLAYPEPPGPTRFYTTPGGVMEAPTYQEEWGIPPAPDLSPGGSQVPATILKAGLLPLGLGAIALGVIKAVWAKFGPVAVKAALGAATFATVVRLITGGASDDTQVKIQKKKRKRLSIGANPRVGTLIRVAKRVDNLFASYDKRVAKFRARIKGPGRRYHHYRHDGHTGRRER